MKIKEDEVIDEIHRVRAELLAEHEGSLQSLVKELQAKQEASGRKVVERLNPPPNHLKAG